ncbi:MAG: 4a-hydroxytetrahydrobiopterin dehydratase [Omnitrophica WOR_2 bacterium]|jgi:4a-hydroxytetrahydrobiopterin dehydratase
MWHKLENDDNSTELVKSYEFSDFKEAFAFCTKIALIAEKLNHHPSITIEYNKVTVSTSSHDAGNTVTDKDVKLTTEIDKLHM